MKKKLYISPMVRAVSLRPMAILAGSTLPTSEKVINPDDGDEFSQAKGGFGGWEDFE